MTEAEKLGSKIRRNRIKKGWTQNDLAEKLGYTTQLVSHWECGKRIPSYFTVKKMESIFRTRF